MTRVFITGSESFVGKELVAQCLAKGIQVVGCDLVSRASQEYKFHSADIRSKEIAEIVPDGADALIHLAALSRDTDCKKEAYKCFDVNVMGTLNMAKVARNKTVKQFIFASSEWVYGSFKADEEKDEDAPVDITKHTSEYALSKFVSEANLRQEYGHGFCPTTILRFAIIYGPRKNNWSAVETLMSGVKSQDTITVGSLKTARRFIHVADVASGIIAAIGLGGFNILNLSGDKLITLQEVIKESETIFNKKVKITETNPTEVSIRNPSNAKIKKILGWSPEVDLRTGLESVTPHI